MNVQVVEPWLAAFDPVAFAEYVVPFFNRVDGVTVTMVQGELHITEPLTALPVLSASVTFADFTGASKVAVTVVSTATPVAFGSALPRPLSPRPFA